MKVTILSKRLGMVNFLHYEIKDNVLFDSSSGGHHPIIKGMSYIEGHVGETIPLINFKPEDYTIKLF